MSQPSARELIEGFVAGVNAWFRSIGAQTRSGSSSLAVRDKWIAAVEARDASYEAELARLREALLYIVEKDPFDWTGVCTGTCRCPLRHDHDEGQHCSWEHGPNCPFGIANRALAPQDGAK